MERIMLNNICIQIKVINSLNINVSIPISLLNEIHEIFYYIANGKVDDYDIFINIENGKIILATSSLALSCNKKEWLFRFLTLLEDISLKKYNKCVFHGSAVSNEKGDTVAFIGTSGAGKTTIATNLINRNLNKCFKISDDMLFLDELTIVPTFLPAKEKSTTSKNKAIVTYTDKEKKRYITRIESVVNNTKKFYLRAIINVRYDAQAPNAHFKKVKPVECIPLLLQNSRNAPNNLFLNNSLIKIVSLVPIYKLFYSNDDYALNCVEKLLYSKKQIDISLP